MWFAGFDVALTSDNRYVRHLSFWQQNPDPSQPDTNTFGTVNVIEHNNRGFYDPDDDPTLPIEVRAVVLTHSSS